MRWHRKYELATMESVAKLTVLSSSGPVQTPLMDRILREVGEKDQPAMEMHKSLAIPRLGTPEELAKTFVFLLSDESSWTTGSVFTVDGGAMC